MVGEEIISSMIAWRKAILWIILSVFILVFPFPASAQDDCLECHGDEDLRGVNNAGAEYSLFIDGTKYESSVHGEDECISCHSGIEEIPHAERLPEVDCGGCHSVSDSIKALDCIDLSTYHRSTI